LHWNTSWQCPEVDFSDSWGVLPKTRVLQWIMGTTGVTNVTMDIVDLLSNGRAGLRLGALSSMAKLARLGGINPTHRKHATRSMQTSDTVALRNCVKHVLSRVDNANLTTQLVQDLFPVAQGITESLPTSYCLRFSIEWAKYKAGVVLGVDKNTLSIWETLYQVCNKSWKSQKSSA